MKRPDEMNYDELEKYREHLEATNCWRCWGTGIVPKAKIGTSDLCDNARYEREWIKCIACGGTGRV